MTSLNKATDTVTGIPEDKGLVEELGWLLPRLPRVHHREPFREADYYGASRLISDRLGLPFPPISRSGWIHGWNLLKAWREMPDIPLEILTSNGSKENPQIVQSEELAGFLRARGWDKVVAGGLPFLYTESSGCERMEGSLLVMPPHVTAETIQDWDEEEYVKEIAGLKSRFPLIVACISGHCVQKGYWTRTFEKHGIPWISGAITSDQNALRRMRTVFDSFEFVTTNKIGSHVAYAAYSGCRVSLWGPDNRRKHSHFSKDGLWSRFPDMLDHYLRLGQRENLFKLYPFLDCEPGKARIQTEWGAKELGEECRRSPEEMAKLLGWRWKPGQDEDYHRRFMHSFSGMLGKGLYALEARLRGLIGRP
jgi:hypothetical protein